MADATRCENCGSTTAWRPLPRSTDTVRCAECGGWSFCRSEDVGDPETLYGEAYFNGGEYAAYAAAASSHRRNFRRKMALLQRNGARPAAESRMLEIGSATGEFLSVAREAGVRELMGVEVSPYCRRVAGERGFEVLPSGTLETLARIERLRPNLVVAWDAWEHLPHPASSLDEILARCDDAVTVAISTVDASSAVARLRGTRWRQFHPPTHLHYPTRHSFRRLFADRGFRIAHHASFGYYRPLVEYLRAVGVAGWGARPALEWARTLPVYLNLWDIQLVIAQREGK